MLKLNQLSKYYNNKQVLHSIDLEINEDGTNKGLIVEKHKFLISSLSNKKELLIKWEEISTYTYREYIHKQLENYNFIDSEKHKES